MPTGRPPCRKYSPLPSAPPHTSLTRGRGGRGPRISGLICAAVMSQLVWGGVVVVVVVVGGVA
uniref:Uncharacterized protein n=1 Tax=Anguilla anguilla TaxID=7936 RepID=A0A0E9PFD3_ANGAN